jgi:hypothetical protein
MKKRERINKREGGKERPFDLLLPFAFDIHSSNMSLSSLTHP